MAAINAFYAQSGGATAVINATACGLIEEARRQHLADPTRIGQVYAGRDGILGALREDLIDTSLESDADIARLRQTPGGAFGSSRFHLGPLATHRAMYERLAAVLAAHDIGYFFINGGEGSMGAAWHLSQMMREIGQPLRVIGIPKTVDNDMVLTDCCPGFGSVAKYIATSVREAGYDVASMSQTSTKVFVLEVMGRHAGWITAAAGLASEAEGEPPHILLLPEVGFDDRKFLARVRHCVETYGYCVVVTAEGLCDAGGCNFGVSSRRAGTVGRYIADMVEVHLGYKQHLAVADYLQRSARHLASAVDVAQAHALGAAALRLALAGESDVAPILHRLSDAPYRWEIRTAPLAALANVERRLPPEFISADGFHITEACRRYLAPLIAGEDLPPFANGLPVYVRLKNQSVTRRLPVYAV
ncbi:6-phosphofructokinase [Azonexus hydrophilus]|uniref:6-phosphofructokinase n=1 Tax=Azonexus hydrophilus TaxID=418702 RepID=UPI0019640AE3|nr:6-phosphofructokinase [Azonexus hydrophilus]